MVRLIFVLLISTCAWGQSAYTFGDWLVLPAAAKTVVLVDETNLRTVISVPPIPGGSDRIAMRIYFEELLSTSDVSCSAPCERSFPRRLGPFKWQWQFRNGPSTVTSTSDIRNASAVTTVRSSPVPMPVEVVGAPGRIEAMEVPATGTLTGTIKLYLQINGLSYQGKAQVRVNGSDWITLTNAAVTERYDEAGDAGGFGGADATQEFSVNLPDGTVVSGNNRISFRFAISQWHSSGFRVLRAQFMRPSTAISSLVVSGSGTSVLANSTGHGLTVGDAVYVHAPGATHGAFRALGWKTVATVPNANSFTYSITSGFDGTYTAGSPVAYRGMVAPTNYTEDDPDLWTPPSTDPARIAAGETLYKTRTLNDPENGGAPIVACAKCHTNDGRDLRYFNFSVEAIKARSQYHFLTNQESEDIASYIFSLDVPNPARPWTPMYQPGPGVRAGSVVNWAAGAGLDMVLRHDSDVLNYLTSDKYAHTANLDVIDVPSNLQFLTWLQWLPTWHPEDVYGSTFTSHQLMTKYNTMLSSLTVGSCASLNSIAGDVDQFKHQRYEFAGLIKGQPGFTWTTATGQQVYSIGLWAISKMWDINQTFGLEACGDTVYDRNMNNWMWTTNIAFQLSPNQVQLDRNQSMVAPGEHPRVHDYISQKWYVLQQVLNSADGAVFGIAPMDWGYTFSFYDVLSNHGTCQWGQSAVTLIRALQAFSRNLQGPEAGEFGFEPNTSNRPSQLTNEWMSPCSIAEYTALERATVLQRYLTALYDKMSTFTPSQYYTGDWATASESIVTDHSGPRMGQKWRSALPRYKHIIEQGGLSSTVVNNFVDYFKTIYTTHANDQWEPIKTATCSYNSGNGHYSCSSD